MSAPETRSNVQDIEALITAHINALAEHDRLYNLGDWDLASEEDVMAALTPVDDALVAICAARPIDPAAQARRAEYLNAKVAEAIDCDKSPTEAVIAALVAGGAS